MILNVKKPNKIEYNFDIKFIKAFVAFKMGVVTIPFTDEILHKNVN